jgi:ABC-type antimicrobial peptide transport system permease subunit
MTNGDIMMFILATAIAIIGYFLKIVHSDVRKNTEEQGKLKGKIELVEQEARLKYQAIQEQTQLEIKNLAKNVGDLADTVRELISK